MHPILFHIGPWPIYTYGFLSAAAVLAAYGWCLRRAKAFGFSDAFASDFMFWIFLAGLAGARGWFVLQSLEEYQPRWVDALMIWQGGLVWYGGFIGGFLAAAALARLRGVGLLTLGDFCLPPLALAHAIGRIGCFLNGCCGGREWLGFTWPTQLMEAAGLLVLAVWLGKQDGSGRRPGLIGALYLAGYGFLRFWIEFLRAGQTHWAGLTIPQWTSLVMVIAGIFLWKKQKSS